MGEETAYTFARMERQLRRLQDRYPFLVMGTVGCSVLGAPIYAVRIGEGPFRWHWNGACHANEWIASHLLMRFLEAYADACVRGGTVGGHAACDLYRRSTAWIVPMVNPDGVDLAQHGLAPAHPLEGRLLEWNGGSRDFTDWKANARGVDLNDQFPARWEEERARRGTAGPGPRDYGGPYPLSEPEAQALADMTRRLDFHAVLALHTQGEEIYWNYREHEPPASEAWANRLAEVSGYRAVRLSGSDAGYKDWFLQAYRRPGFTVEAGLGANPLPMSDAEKIYGPLSQLLAEALALSADVPAP